MPDKEQVIIDGCDVSECEYVCNTAFGNIGCKLPFNEEIHCCNIPNCYFKQLARKTQECDTLISQLDFEVQQKECIEQECEELKEQLQANQPTGICETCMAKAILQNDKYRKALEEIEAVCQEDTYTFADGKQIRYDSLDDILTIINKARKDKNE